MINVATRNLIENIWDSFTSILECWIEIAVIQYTFNIFRISFSISSNIALRVDLDDDIIDVSRISHL